MISAIVLTKNEENNIKECLDRLAWCDELIVIDDDSIDKTEKIAKECGAKVIKHALGNHFAKQRNFGLEKAMGDWVFFVDADERVSEELKEEIEEKLKENKEIKGYFLKRIDKFMGKFLKYGEIGGVGRFGGIKILRLAKKDAGKWIRNVDEVWKIDGKTEIVENPLLHYPHPDLTQFLESINERSTLNAKYLFQESENSDCQVGDEAVTINARSATQSGTQKPDRKVVGFLFENSGNLNLFEWSKPALKFINNYFFHFGFLDGVAGFVFAILMSLHSFLVRGKLYLLLEKRKLLDEKKIPRSL